MEKIKFIPKKAGIRRARRTALMYAAKCQARIIV
jgi:hypothetical protein